MERRSRISLDDPAFRGRLRTARNAVRYEQTHAAPASIGFRDIQATRPKLMQPTPLTKAKVVSQPKPRPHLPKQTRSHVLKRQMVKSTPIKYRKHRPPLVPTLLSAMAIILFTTGLLVAFSSTRSDHNVKAQVKELAKQTEDGTSTDSVPSEDDPPANLGAYSVAPDMPKLLTIEKFGVSARIRRVGVDPNNVLKAPSNIFDVGWYEGSAKPGENGTTVIDGHVSGPTKQGVFYSIGSLKNGDKIKLARGDGKVFTYSVTGKQVYDHDKVDMPKVLTTSVPGKPGLNLVTCGGRFNVRTNSFEQRVVVFATQD